MSQCVFLLCQLELLYFCRLTFCVPVVKISFDVLNEITFYFLVVLLSFKKMLLILFQFQIN